MVDYRMIAETPYISIPEIGNALMQRQAMQNNPLQQMRQAEALQTQKYANRIAFMEEQKRIEDEKIQRAARETAMNIGIPAPQVDAMAAGARAPVNALFGMTSAPTAAPTPQGWRPPMAMPPEGAAPAPAPAPAPADPAFVPYTPEGWGEREAKMQHAALLRSMSKEQQDRLKEKVDFIKKVSEVMGPEVGAKMWNDDETLARLGGKHSVAGTGDSRDVLDSSGKLIGRSVRTPDGKWSFHEAKKEGLTSEPGKLMEDRDKVIAAKVKAGVKPEDALNDPDVQVLDKKIKEGKSAYPIGHVQAFQEGRNMVYKEYKGDGKWEVRKDLGGGPKDLPPQVADDFKVWDKETKLWHFENFKNTGVKPDFGWGKDAGRSRAQFQREYADWNIGKGVTGAEAGAVGAEYKAKSMSVRNQEKIRGMMGGFVRNMDKQIVRVDDLFGKIVQRVGVRAMDYPLREIKTRAIGSGNEAIIEAYLLEISNEIGKLSTGSAASIQELSKEAQVKWAKIHDPNLSPREIKKILTETRHMGQLRLDSSDEEIKKTLNDMKNIDKNVPVGKEAKGEGKVEPRKPGESVADYLRRTKK